MEGAIIMFSPSPGDKGKREGGGYNLGIDTST